ncbi:MAG: transglycosylase SLT domain-containing protein [Proteobacteria bacterium]|nr:transglycosylase SLT domain-containing protein [Pseudomonadota bacterium]
MTPPTHTDPPAPLAWGGRVSATFRAAVRSMARRLQVQPDWLMACIAFETGATFRPDIRNAAGSGAVGLIQFMPATAAALGTSTARLEALTAEQQLVYVEQYLRPWAKRLHDLADVYMAILWPAAIGRADDAVLFRREDPRRPKLYIQNAGLDYNRDGVITKAECAARVHRMLDLGLRAENVG